jgi:galactose mutarotase-like enzyme
MDRDDLAKVRSGSAGVLLKQFRPISLSSDSLQVETIPELGAKISSIKILPAGTELLQQPLRPYAERSRTMAFEEGDASGFDECLPTVSGCEIQTAEGKIAIPDHGDFWRIPFSGELEGNTLTLKATGYSLPLEFTKKLILDDSELEMHYSVRNLGTTPTELAWSAHPLFHVDADDRVVLPPSSKKVTVEGSGKDRLGKSGQEYSWPLAQLRDGTSIDLSRCGGVKDETGDKLYLPAPLEGWCAIERKDLNARIEVRFDADVTPYLGLWLCYGGWPLNQASRQQCVALEPCSAPVDSLAIASAKGWARKLAPGEGFEWTISIRVSSQ